MQFSIPFIENRVAHWQQVLDCPQYYDDEEVGVAADRLAWWLKQLAKAKKA